MVTSDYPNTKLIDIAQAATSNELHICHINSAT